MLKKRFIAVLIIRDGQVVQSVRFKHTNVIHYDPAHAVECFNKWSIDELVMLNVSPSPDSRPAFLETVASISGDCFVPLSVGGWINNSQYAQDLLANGADKLVVNTIIADKPKLVNALSKKFGRQCIVASIDVTHDNKKDNSLVMVDRGRRSTGSDLRTWAERAERLGAGEIFFNSINHDGARKGYDLTNLTLLCRSVKIPVIAFGGVFSWNHLLQGIDAGADAVAAANILHYTEHSCRKAKKFLMQSGVPVRKEMH
ncbi:imidazole glycerol phosphate synthase subunit HisF [Desulfobacterota bacterium M19]